MDDLMTLADAIYDAAGNYCGETTCRILPEQADAARCPLITANAAVRLRKANGIGVFNIMELENWPQPMLDRATRDGVMPTCRQPGKLIAVGEEFGCRFVLFEQRGRLYSLADDDLHHRRMAGRRPGIDFVAMVAELGLFGAILACLFVLGHR